MQRPSAQRSGQVLRQRGGEIADSASHPDLARLLGERSTGSTNRGRATGAIVVVAVNYDLIGANTGNRNPS